MWCDVKCHKRFGLSSLNINWFSNEMVKARSNNFFYNLLLVLKIRKVTSHVCKLHLLPGENFQVLPLQMAWSSSKEAFFSMLHMSMIYTLFQDTETHIKHPFYKSKVIKLPFKFKQRTLDDGANINQNVFGHDPDNNILSSWHVYNTKKYSEAWISVYLH